ncbi:hypothetical protein L3488_004158 [Salmonella enterica subsp. enterica serovar Agbeni]|nr:hypothetical protein [Salmonella enterica subsp. enterica serovar Agbeni]
MCKRQLTDISGPLIDSTRQMMKQTELTDFVVNHLSPRLNRAGVMESEPVYGTAIEWELWRDRNVKRVSRIINGEQAMPVSWIIPWLDALPDGIANRCRNTLSAALGLLPVIAITPRDGVTSGIDRLSKEFSDVLAAARPAFDGEYSVADNPTELQQLQNELYELSLRTTAEIVAIAAATGITPGGVDSNADCKC